MTNSVKITDKMYREFIAGAIATDGWQVADKANKLALEIEAISVDLYLAAAHIILDAYRKEQDK